MEKLIECYNEYNQKKNLKEYYDYIKDIELPEKFDSLTFLKDFCKWLVKNDKIERDKTDIEKSEDKRYDEGIVLASNYDNDTYVVEKYYSYTEQLLMILSIQDNPLEYLCSILK